MANAHREPEQLDLLAWSPPTAEIVFHPAKWKAIWGAIVDEIAEAIVDEPEYAERRWIGSANMVRSDMRNAGASDVEIEKHVKLYLQALAAAVARLRQSVRPGPGAA